MKTLPKLLLSVGIIGALIIASYGATLSFDGVDDYVNVGANAAFKMTNQLTLEGWINPSGSTQGVIAGREGEYLLTRFPDGTIRYALNVPSPGWVYVTTSAVALT